MKSFEERMNSIQAKARRRKQKKTVITASVSATLIASLLLVLFVPYNTTPPSVRQYTGSEYYALIEKLNDYTFTRPAHKNNFEALVSALDFSDQSPGADYSAGVANGSDNLLNSGVVNQESITSGTGSGTYEEVTDNQVAGVTEADIIKRSDKYIYHLFNNTLYVYTIAQEASACVGEYSFPGLIGVRKDDGKDLYLRVNDMYLSEDCSTVTVQLDGSYGAKKNYRDVIVLVNLDVTDPGNIRESGRILFEGRIPQTRMIDGDILLTYNADGYKNTIDFSDENTFVPQYGWVDDLQKIPMEDIILPETVDSSRYTVVCKLDGKTLDVEGTKALLCYTGSIYVSKDNVYLTHSYTSGVDKDTYGTYTRKQLTEITGISYEGNQLEVLGSVTVEGRIRDQYSMDEYEGIFRVVTTTVERKVEVSIGSTHYYPSVTNVNLYCIGLENWQIVGKVEKFAPEGEEAMSARFDGVNAYVCTAEVIKFTDPVYFFDLSDPQNITYTDTGTIDGYSTSLVQFGNGNLIGIGYGDFVSLKIEVYREGDGIVESLCSYERTCIFSSEYKSYYIDREKQLIGLAISDGYNQDYYLLLRFNGSQLQTVREYALDDYYGSKARADIIDGWLYLLTDGLDVYEVDL